LKGHNFGNVPCKKCGKIHKRVGGQKKGRHVSEESIQRITIANRLIASRLSEEERQKRRERWIGSKNPNWKEEKDLTKSAGYQRANKLFLCPEGMERHHIDGNPLNNSPENVKIVTHEEHMIIDGRIQRNLLDHNNGRIFSQETRLKIGNANRKERT